MNNKPDKPNNKTGDLQPEILKEINVSPGESCPDGDQKAVAQRPQHNCRLVCLLGTSQVFFHRVTGMQQAIGHHVRQFTSLDHLSIYLRLADPTTTDVVWEVCCKAITHIPQEKWNEFLSMLRSRGFLTTFWEEDI